MSTINPVPQFKLAEIPVEIKDIPKLIGGEAQDVYVEDFNGDGTPDELHVLREGSHVGFRLVLGNYVDVEKNARSSNPLFSNLSKRLQKTDVGFIWEAKGKKTDVMRITHCLIRDLNKNGLPDIRFAASRALEKGGWEVYAFDLLSQGTEANLPVENKMPLPKQPPASHSREPSDTMGFWIGERRSF